MNEVTLEESSQVLNYYAKRSADLELQLLMSQAKTNTLVNEIQGLKAENAKLKSDIEVLKSQGATFPTPKITKVKSTK